MNISDLKKKLRIPVISAPLFILSNPETVIAQCKAGIVGSFPALNARGDGELERWIDIIESSLNISNSENSPNNFAPYAINQIVHKTNSRLERDLKISVDKKVPLMITSLRPPNEVVSAAHSYGGLVFHDIINIRHAEKAIEAGVDGLILVSAGAGGHAGTLNPFALLSEVKKIYSGPIVLAGSITRGEQILAAKVLGADFVYIGTRFICSQECNAPQNYKEMILNSTAEDIIYTDFFTGIYGSYLKKSAEKAGYKENYFFSFEKFKLLSQIFINKAFKKINFSSFEKLGAKAWKDIWSAGQGVGSIDKVISISEIVDLLEHEYLESISRINKEN